VDEKWIEEAGSSQKFNTEVKNGRGTYASVQHVESSDKNFAASTGRMRSPVTRNGGSSMFNPYPPLLNGCDVWL
jgi:hypothetical protein